MIADERNVVERDRHRRIGRHRNRLRADAAQLDAVAGEIGLGEGHVRHLLEQIGTARGLRSVSCFCDIAVTEIGTVWMSSRLRSAPSRRPFR